MTSRITDTQMSRGLVESILTNRSAVERYSQEVSTGYKVASPGDSNMAGTISQLRDSLDKIEGYRDRISSVEGYLSYKESILSRVNEVMIRANEIAVQGANESISDTERQKLAPEIFQLREEIATLANSTYKGRYVFGNGDDGDPPYDRTENFYSVPTASNDQAAAHWALDSDDGKDVSRSVQVTDSLSITLNDTSPDQIFDNSLYALERLGRALQGYRTQPYPENGGGTPVTGDAGDAFTFPDDYALQTQDIQNAMTLIDNARDTDIMPQRVEIGGKLRRLETAKSVLELSQTSATEVLDRLQNADLTVSISNLSRAQTALEASFSVTSRVLNLSILNYI